MTDTPLAERYGALLAEWKEIVAEHTFSVEYEGGRLSVPICSCGWQGEFSRRNRFSQQDEWQKHFNWIAKNFRTRTGFMERMYPDQILRTPYGSVENVIGTGRATCRVCLYKIAKGESAVRAYVDTIGSGSWTAVLVQAHERCVCPEHKEEA